MWKPPKNPRVTELTKSWTERSANLDFIRPLKLEELDTKGRPKKLCAWCHEGVLRGGNQKYCSNDCSDSAMAWAYPQKENGLKFLLVRQDWKCAECKFDYAIAMKDILDREANRYPATADMLWFKDHSRLPWYYMKRLKDKLPKDRKPEVDHIVPIYKGGASLGLENHQAICYTCHKTKTKSDLSGKRSK